MSNKSRKIGFPLMKQTDNNRSSNCVAQHSSCSIDKRSDSARTRAPGPGGEGEAQAGGGGGSPQWCTLLPLVQLFRREHIVDVTRQIIELKQVFNCWSSTYCRLRMTTHYLLIFRWKSLFLLVKTDILEPQDSFHISILPTVLVCHNLCLLTKS